VITAYGSAAVVDDNQLRQGGKLLIGVTNVEEEPLWDGEGGDSSPARTRDAAH